MLLRAKRKSKPPPGCLSPEEAAELLGVEQGSVYKRLRRVSPNAITYRDVVIAKRIVVGFDAEVVKGLAEKDGRPVG